MWALEQKTFWPLRTKPPLTRSAAVVSEPTSEPASGSVIAIASTDAAGDPAEDLRLLLLGAEALGRAGDDQRRRVAADRRQAAGGLLHEQAGVEHRAARAAVLLGDRHPEPAELGHLACRARSCGARVWPSVSCSRCSGVPHSRSQKSRIAATKSLLLVGEGEVHRRRSLEDARPSAIAPRARNRIRRWRRPNAQVLRWESSASRRTPLPQDDNGLTVIEITRG